MDAYKVDQLMDNYNDVIGTVYKPFFTEDEAVKATQIADIFGTIVPKFLDGIEERCGAGEFLVGNTLTIADFYVAGLYTNFCTNPDVPFAKE